MVCLNLRECVRRMFEEEIRVEKFGFRRQSPSALTETAWPGRVDWFVYWRVVASVYLTIWCFLSALLDADWYSRPLNRLKYFIYLSDWNFILMTVTSILQLILVLKYRRHRYPYTVDENVDTLAWYEKMFWLAYTMTSGCAIVVSAFYWLFLYTGGRPHVVTIHLHIINSVYVLVDLFLSAIPIRLLHGIYTLLYGAVYTAFVMLYRIFGGTNAMDKGYIYWILDWDTPLRAAFFSVLGILCAMPAHCVIFMIYKVRERMTVTPCVTGTEPLLDDQ